MSYSNNVNESRCHAVHSPYPSAAACHSKCKFHGNDMVPCHAWVWQSATEKCLLMPYGSEGDVQLAHARDYGLALK